MTYQDQIKSPKWQKKRLEVLEQNQFACIECGSADEQLHVHHPFYQKGRKIWEYTTEELRCLCATCHDKLHALNDEINQAMGLMETMAGNGIKERILGYLDGMAGPPRHKNPTQSYKQGYMDGSYVDDLNVRYEIEAHRMGFEV